MRSDGTRMTRIGARIKRIKDRRVLRQDYRIDKIDLIAVDPVILSDTFLVLIREDPR
jgi:hypothetical protein